MRRLTLVLTALALTLGIAQTAPASSSIASKQCADFCSRVRCAYPTVCGPYTDPSGQTVCGCH